MSKSFTVAGGGNFNDEQQQIMVPEIHVEVAQPPQDNTLLWMSGIVVPVVLFAIGLWVNNRRKKNQ